MKGLFSLCLFSSHHSVCFHLQFFTATTSGVIQTGSGINEMHEEEKERMRLRGKVVCGGVIFLEIHTALFPGGSCRGLFTPPSTAVSASCVWIIRRLRAFKTMGIMVKPEFWYMELMAWGGLKCAVAVNKAVTLIAVIRWQRRCEFHPLLQVWSGNGFEIELFSGSQGHCLCYANWAWRNGQSDKE